jgi:hypothetical protein
MFSSNGNFYMISQDPAVTAALPLMADGTPFSNNDTNTGNSFVVVEENTGLTMQAQSSVQTNYQIFNDNLFVINQAGAFGTFVPREWTLKQMSYTSQTTSSLFAYQGSINTDKWVFFSICIGAGLIGLGLGVVLLMKFNKLKKTAGEPLRED